MFLGIKLANFIWTNGDPVYRRIYVALGGVGVGVWVCVGGS